MCGLHIGDTNPKGAMFVRQRIKFVLQHPTVCETAQNKLVRCAQYSKGQQYGTCAVNGVQQIKEESSRQTTTSQGIQ